MHHMDCECTCVCVLLGGDPGTPVEHEFSGLRRFWKVQRNGHTPHHPLSVPVELEVVPMTCWAVLVSNSARRSFFSQASRSRANHSQNEPCALLLACRVADESGGDSRYSIV